MMTIYEIDYSVSPNGVNAFEIFDMSNEYVCSYDNLVDATRYCYTNGYDYSVKLLANYSY